jgi:hypothetical protein
VAKFLEWNGGVGGWSVEGLPWGMTTPLVAGSDEEAHGSCYGQILLLKPRISSEEALQAKVAAKEIAENRRNLFGTLPVRIMSKSAFGRASSSASR